MVVETAAAKYLQSKEIRSRSKYPGPLQLLDELRASKVLTEPQELAYSQLRRLRNEAVHHVDAEFTRTAVTNYIDSAITMAVYLDTLD